MLHIPISDYNYPLPDAQIARYPKEVRDESRLLVRQADGTLEESTFYEIPRFIPQGTLMICNNTRVIYARLRFQKPTGAHIEVFCLEPASPADYQVNFSTRQSVTWTCLVGGLKRWKSGILQQEVNVNGEQVVLQAERLAPQATGHEIRFTWNGTATFAEILEACGELPIPPYLNRATEESDLQTYQTVFSRIKGSVAAPTAGLHYTPRVLEALQTQGVEREEITLHVGAGTFRPVKSKEISEHEMHAEWICVTRHVLQRLLAHEGNCMAVGTTSVRTLESLYYLADSIRRTPEISPEALHVAQWAPYEADAPTPETFPATEALQVLLRYMDAHHLDFLHASTQIIIAPGYEYKFVRIMQTNFHQPQSTLLLLVSAFIGDAWREMYNYALAHDFRFLSYGDACLLFQA